jgi:hypothetical protein
VTYAEILTYLAGAGVGLTWSAAGSASDNLFAGDLPDRAEVAEPHVGVRLYMGAKPAEPNFGAADLKHEWPRLQVVVRGPADDELTAHNKAHDCYLALGKVQAQTLSGTFYKQIVCLQPPFLLKRDDNGRFVYAFNIEVQKDVSTV